MAKPSKPGHHLIGYIKHIVLVTNLTGTPVITCRWHDHPTCAHDRLGNKTGDILRSQFGDLVLQIRYLFSAELLFAHAIGAAIGIG